MAKLQQFETALPTPMIDKIKSGSFGAFGIDNSVSDLLLPSLARVQIKDESP
ncbi:MAG: hypothetical protein NDI77_00965 [Geobacteraceae bacterium]|nr:hypothetical protein [Geobacteraceae bacterium]